MKTRLFIFVGFLAYMSAIQAAYADNAGVENAIKSRPELYSFYQALVNTGVNHELNAGVSYTIFAPTNEAFSRIRQDKYPCFYSVECRLQVAEIVRNHIIPGKVYIKDIAKQEGGIFSIGGRIVRIGEPSKDDYAVDGNNVLHMSSFGGGGILYKIDGVIVNPRELASLQDAEYASATSKEVTTITKKTIPDPACGPGGCPDAVTQTTTVTRTVVDPSVVTAPMLAPAR